MPGMPVLTAAIRNRLTAPVTFGPTRVMQLPVRLALKFIKSKGWDIDCKEMPPINKEAKAALKAYESSIGSFTSNRTRLGSRGVDLPASNFSSKQEH